jgi:ABC-type multidrug transport system ATPase subunit
MAVSLQNLSIEVGNNTKQSKKTLILQSLSTTIGSGTLFAILGGSGSGKTTLLNVIAGRYNKNAYLIKGDVFFNDISSYKVGFVSQQDYLLPFLTVHETLMFAAKMYISTNAVAEQPTKEFSSFNNSKDIFEMAVDNVVLDLGLKECVQNFIGDDNLVTGKRGVSGGEKRRVSIGIRILSNPSSFFFFILFSISFIFVILSSYFICLLCETMKSISTLCRRTSFWIRFIYSDNNHGMFKKIDKRS